jgi:hypothetical protein
MNKDYYYLTIAKSATKTWKSFCYLIDGRKIIECGVTCGQPGYISISVCVCGVKCAVSEPVPLSTFISLCYDIGFVTAFFDEITELCLISLNRNMIR